VTLKISSPAFKNNDYIPSTYTCEDRNISPTLLVDGIPENAKSLSLIMDDPDAPMGTFVHWVAWNIELVYEIPERIPKEYSVTQPLSLNQGKNSARQTGYMGPCPPVGHGVHHYHFKLYALDITLDLPQDTTKEDLLKAMEGHIVEQTEIVGLYRRD